MAKAGFKKVMLLYETTTEKTTTKQLHHP